MPLGPVEIGAREIYDEVRATRSDVQGLRASAAQQATTASDHETRIRGLERGRWPLPSLAAIVSIAALIVAAAALGRH